MLVMLISCLLIRLFRRSLSACPQFLVTFVGMTEMGRVWDDVVVGCGMWTGRELR